MTAIPRRTVSQQAWAELMSLSKNDCTGALILNPANAKLVRLMGQAVGDTSWMDKQ